MKTLYYKIIAPALILFGIMACNKDGEQLTVSTSGEPELTVSATDIDLDATRSGEKALEVNWTTVNAQWSNPSVANGGITYALQLSKAGLEFKSTVGAMDLQAGQTSQLLTMSELNSMMIAAGCEVGQEVQVELRLVASLAPNAKLYSNVVTLTATPFDAISHLYVPGAYQGWNPVTAESLISQTSNGIYTGIIYFPETGSAFKITPQRNWDQSYGEVSDGKIELNGGGDIKAPRAGNLELTVNINENTITYKDYSWGIVGDATPGGWDTDTDMRYENSTQLWKATLELKVGDIKFRKDHDWGTNYGGANGNLNTESDNDIAITEAGTYDVVIDLANLKYSLTKK